MWRGEARAEGRNQLGFGVNPGVESRKSLFFGVDPGEGGRVQIGDRRDLEIGCMKDIEVNSDKYTVLFACFALAMFLIMFLSNLYGLMRHRSAAHSNLEFGTYLAAIFNTYLVVIACRDSQFRKKYPYGIAGVCGMAARALIEIAMHWTRASAETQNLAGTILMVLTVVASGLVLVEGFRWFKKNVRSSANV